MDIGKYQKIEFRRKFWKFFGAEVKAVNPDNDTVVGVIRMKAFKLRDDVRLYMPAESNQEAMRIHARQVIDFGATYDVYLGADNNPAFSLQRKGFKSAFVRDYWKLLDPAGNQIGYVQETSSGLAVARRWFGMIPFVGEIVDLIFAFIPQTYGIYAGQDNLDAKADATITHRKNPLIIKMSLDASGAEQDYNPYFGIAAVSLLSVMDASKN